MRFVDPRPVSRWSAVTS